LSIPETKREKVARQLADYFYQLSTIQFEKIGRLWCGTGLNEQPTIIPCSVGASVNSDKGTQPVGPFATSLEYFYRQRKQQTRQIHTLHPNEQDWSVVSWILEKALPSMIVEECIYGPFPLCHLDLHYNNVLLDSDYNITGIIDWSDAQTVPVERFAVSPEFVTLPGLSFKANEPIRAFREMFIKALEEIECKHHANSEQESFSLSKIVGSPLAELVFRCTYSYPWRALSDARLVLCLLYGGSLDFAEGKTDHWENFKQLYGNSKV
jgi:hypothetical protein